MVTWWFKDVDKKLMMLQVEGDCVIDWKAGPHFPPDDSILKILCEGIITDLIDSKECFSKNKKYFINDFHFEKEQKSGPFWPIFCAPRWQSSQREFSIIPHPALFVKTFFANF